MAKLGIKLTEEPLDGAALAARLAQWKRKPQAAKVQAAQTLIENLRAELAKPARASAGRGVRSSAAQKRDEAPEHCAEIDRL